ncbi:MAG TPA: tetratricopeptide repeat protein [Kofleriaceae bacterium]
MQVEQAETGGCPSENTVAALFEEALAPERRAAVGDHVDGCDACRRLVAVLAQSRMQTTVLGKRIRFARASEAPDGRALLAPGAALGRYRIERVLGQGGMGVVYAAFDPELGRRVAVKVIRPELAGYGALIAARLAREARAMAQVTHPNVIAVYDVGSDDGQVFVAMELVEGHTLREWLRERERSWREVIEVFRAAGEGLAAAHDARLVHRDFKPDNVLIDRAGRVRVSDFGLARAVAEEAHGVIPRDGVSGSGGDRSGGKATSEVGIAAGSGTLELTRTGATVGTPAYMAPEQHGHRPTDERTDQFSFCVALWEALCGERPFPGENALELADAVVHGRLRPAPRGKAPRWLRAALERGMSVEPDDRFRSMRALLRAIRPRRSRLVWVAAAAGAAVLVAGGGALLHAGDERPADPAAVIASCADRADSRMAEVWSAKRRAAVLHALAPSGDSERWHLVARALDRYAESWKDMDRESCEAGARGTQSPDVLDLRAHCLETHLSDFEVVLGLLESDEPVVLEQALEAVDSLASVDRCSAVETIEARTPLPRDPAQRAEVQSLRRELARADALRLTGKLPEAKTALEALSQKAAALGYKPFTADVLYFLGVLQSATANPAEGEATLVKAAHMAEASRYDQLAADAWIVLIDIAAQDTGDLDKAVEYGEHARAALDRLDGRHTRLEAQYRHHMGVLAWQKSEPEAALGHFAESRRLWQVLGDDDAALGPTEGMALVYEDQGRVMESIELHREILDARTRLLGADHPDTALSHTNLASALMMTGQNGDALEHLERALAIRERANGPEHVDTARLHHNIGEVLRHLGRYDEALAHHEKALAVFRRELGERHQDVATVIEHEAGVMLDLGRAEEGVGMLERALAMFEQATGADSLDATRCRINLADSLRRTGRFRRALPHDRRALEQAEAALGPDSLYGAFANMGIGQDLLGLRRADEAIAPLERAIERMDASAADPVELARARFALARALTGRGRPPIRARELAESARTALATGTGEAASLRGSIERWLEMP